MKTLILCDLDCVLADNTHRAHLLPNKGDCNTTEKWDAFNQACSGDNPIPGGFVLLRDLVLGSPQARWALWSGRTEDVSHQSQLWFDEIGRSFFDAESWYYLYNSNKTGYFRPRDDHRKASRCKTDLAARAVLNAGLAAGDRLILIDDDLSVLQECKQCFPEAVCVWYCGVPCVAQANGVVTE